MGELGRRRTLEPPTRLAPTMIRNLTFVAAVLLAGAGVFAYAMWRFLNDMTQIHLAP